MDDRARIALGMGIGAAVGGFVGFLLFTDRGRAFRQELEPQLEQLFASVGQVSSVRLIRDQATGRSRGFGFVEMDDDAQGRAACGRSGRRPRGARRKIGSRNITSCPLF